MTTILLIAAINGAAIGVGFAFFGPPGTVAAVVFMCLAWTAVFLFAIDGMRT